MSDFFVNFAAGLVTALVLWLLAQLVRVVVIPRYQNMIYQGPNLTGRWSSHDSEEGDAVGTMDVKQNAHAVTATLHRHRSRMGREIDRTFEYEGKYYDGRLTLIFNDRALRGLVSGAVVLRLDTKGKTLRGRSVYFDDDEGEVVAKPLFLKR